MGKKVACICGKKGRVQHNRMTFLRDKYMPYLDIYESEKEPDFSKYDVVYYSCQNECKKPPRHKKLICTVTSHKYDVEKLKRFDAIAVNNTYLLMELQDLSPVLTGNGVDTNFWEFAPYGNKCWPNIGWVGSRDRAAKNYKSLVVPIRDRVAEYVFWKEIGYSKEEEYPFTSEQMKEYYRTLDVLLVTSDSEGTPNPALEAMACGTPVISTPVGNMCQIINVDIIRRMGNKEGMIDEFERLIWTYMYGDGIYRIKVRKEMERNWDWSIKYKAWDEFFRRNM